MGRLRTCVCALLGSVVVAFVGCQLADGPGAGPKGLGVDNSRCHVCHINYEDEEFAVRHARANVGCEKCHGASDAHCGDENNVTPPDLMYPKAKVNLSCWMCHDKATLAKVADHKPALAAVEARTKLCTDCHGQHRLARRDVRWDKATGKLLEE